MFTPDSILALRLPGWRPGRPSRAFGNTAGKPLPIAVLIGGMLLSFVFTVPLVRRIRGL